ncbi:hypothetical protein OHA70_08465 [Kribbella sp. NBC_00382]|uniref:hypothetical protein n=1 Tax=Kribbella sp. NBC_00382 TaxID=2975967 RepID=UPI002E1E5E31
MTRDPLFWGGLVLGAVGGVIGVIVRDLSFGDAAWAVFCGTITFTWLGAGGIGVLIRGYFRRRRDRSADLKLILSDVPVKEAE